jgi:phospholipase C
MLENRSFDHMLGFSGISGVDASSGVPTRARGLAPLNVRPVVAAFQADSLSAVVRRKGQRWPPSLSISVYSLLTSNLFNGKAYEVQQGAEFMMPNQVDPPHEFKGDAANGFPPGVLEQLCGLGAAYSSGAPYPVIANTGFVDAYMKTADVDKKPGDPREIMKCYSPQQLPVLNRLAAEFVVCDNWHASLPGPTWPNRFFSHAASSGGLDHSPTQAEIVEWETIDGFAFKNGTIFDALTNASLPWRIYAGDNFPVVGGLKGIHPTAINDYQDFANDISKPDYSAVYTLIEPCYNALNSYKCGTSQHPCDDVTRGEMLIKCTYEALRDSPIWSSSLLIITWDEHGGFFDHLPPQRNTAVAPGDTMPNDSNSWYGFAFTQYGPRVPAVVISPLIPRNLIDHNLYDHASIPATIEKCFGLGSMTNRDAAAKDLSWLASLPMPRSDAPLTLPSPAASGNTDCDPFTCTTPTAAKIPSLSDPEGPIDKGNFPGFLHSALRSDLALSAPEAKPAILARVRSLNNRAEAWKYMSEVQQKIRMARLRGA